MSFLGQFSPDLAHRFLPYFTQSPRKGGRAPCCVSPLVGGFSRSANRIHKEEGPFDGLELRARRRRKIFQRGWRDLVCLLKAAEATWDPLAPPFP